MQSLTSSVAVKVRSPNSLNPFLVSSSSLEPPTPPLDRIDTTPKKLEWKLIPEIRAGVRFAETRISDLICQNDCQALEFKGYGKNFITSHGFSPDAFVQMAFQAAYFGLYGMQTILNIILLRF
jgi:carnitine O-acetyltransferase